MASERSRLLEIIRRTSYLESESPDYKLASGAFSQYYVDCKKALSDPEARECLAAMIIEIVGPSHFDAIGGLEIGAYPIATSVSDKIYRDTGRKVRVFVVRKDRKKHGITSLVAGDVKPSDHVVIVDDVITSGGSAIQAIEAVRDAGMTVDHVIAMVDREESGRENIEARRVKFDTLFTLDDLKNSDGPKDKGDGRKSDQKRSERNQSSRAAANS
jgi:orotate phosphoribosyltransferase